MKGFYKKKQLKKHRKKHESQLACPSCNRYFSTQQNLEHHKTWVHDSSTFEDGVIDIPNFPARVRRKDLKLYKQKQLKKFTHEYLKIKK